MSWQERPCVGTGPVTLQRYILQLPPVFAVSIVWGPEPSVDVISAVVHSLPHWWDPARALAPTALSGPAAGPGLAGAGDSVASVGHAPAAPLRPYQLRGFICYYGKHYLSFFYSPSHAAWLRFNDGTIKVSGGWEDTAEKIIRGHLQPTILFFQDTA